jgi:MurNAc alpha-1-phosphate uridylyltransferase
VVPKPLIEVAGRPFLEYQLELLAEHGATRVVLSVGHLGEQIEERIGTSRYGISISYAYDGPGLDGTLGALRRASPILGDRFVYLYGDTYLQMDFGAAVSRWNLSGLPALMAVLRNDGAWDASNASFDGSLVVAYDKARPTPDMQWIDYGFGGFVSSALGLVGEDERDLATLHRELASDRLLCGYEATERFFEIGTPVALEETEAYLQRRSQR